MADFNLPKGALSAESAERVVEVYRRGGRLSLKAVKKILRDAYKALKGAPNLNRATVAPGARVHVVGDLHGQLPDLLHIIDDAGMPSATNVFVFNGDFVDRGPLGVEVMLTLFALLLGCPDGAVFLNRGNHEDGSICAVYGFQGECRRKYDDMVRRTFARVAVAVAARAPRARARALARSSRAARSLSHRAVRSVALLSRAPGAARRSSTCSSRSSSTCRSRPCSASACS